MASESVYSQRDNQTCSEIIDHYFVVLNDKRFSFRST
jgi:hypothetical protein